MNVDEMIQEFKKLYGRFISEIMKTHDSRSTGSIRKMYHYDTYFIVFAYYFISSGGFVSFNDRGKSRYFCGPTIMSYEFDRNRMLRITGEKAPSYLFRTLTEKDLKEILLKYPSMDEILIGIEMEMV